MLAVARAGVGIGESAIVPAGMATISDRYPEEKRPMAMGIFYAGGMIGILLAWVVGGWVSETWGWRYAFFLAAPPGLLLAAMIARHGASLRISAKASTDAPPKAEQSGPSTFGIVLGNRPLMWLIAAGSIVTFVNIGLVTQLGSFFIRSHGMTLTQVGLVFGPIMAAGMALGLLGGGAIGNRLAKCGPAALILFSAATTLCMVPLYTITLLAEGLAPALAAMFVANVCSVLYSPAFSAAYQSICPAPARATAAGISGCANAVIGGALTTWAVGMLSDAWMPRFGVDSLRYAMLAGLATCFLSAAMFLHARRLVQRSIRP